jgi:hypothetical protein
VQKEKRKKTLLSTAAYKTGFCHREHSSDARPAHMWSSHGSTWQQQYLAFEHDEVHPRLERTTAEQNDEVSAPTLAVLSTSGAGAQREQPVHAPHGTVPAAGAGTPSGTDDLAVPSAEQLPDWLARVVEAHGAERVVKELIRVCPRAVIEDACNRAWGERPEQSEAEYSRRVRALSARHHPRLCDLCR